ncbi:MAG: slipin family protein, partial [Acidimicrobiales bacterium]
LAATEMAATPAALQLRLLQTIVEVAAEKNSTVVLPFPVELLRFLEQATAPASAPQPTASEAPPAEVEVAPAEVEAAPAGVEPALDRAVQPEAHTAVPRPRT